MIIKDLIYLFVIITLTMVFAVVFKEYKKETIKFIPTYIEVDSPINYDRLGDFVITHYTHTGNKTASGIYPKAKRTVACDTSIIPFGTVIYIDGQAYICEDTGRKIKGNRIDIFVDSKDEAIKKGVIKKEVFKIGK